MSDRFICFDYALICMWQWAGNRYTHIVTRITDYPCELAQRYFC